MSIAGTLANPLVLAGGAAIGLVMLLTRGNTQGPVVGVDPSIINANVALNKVAANSQMQLAQIDGKIAEARISANVVQTGQVFSYLTNAAQSAAVIERERVISSAAIVNNMITSQSAQVIDANNNAVRLGMAQIEATRSVSVARIQGDVEKYKAKKAAQSSLFGAIAGVAKTAIGAATGIPLTGGGSNGQGSISSTNLNWGGTPISFA